MRVLVVNRADNASTNIRDRLLEHPEGDWVDTGSTFRGHPIHQRGYDVMLEVDGPTILDEDLSDDLAHMGWPVDAVWFLSRHRAQSGQPSLTVHPIGNHAAAQFGGRNATLSTAAPRDMGALLRRLAHHRDAQDLPHEVTYEATHHGPFMEQPSLFVEVGSDEQWYDDVPSAQALANAVIDVLDDPPRGDAQRPILVGVGGGHYTPRWTKMALDGEADFGHMLASYAIDAEDHDAAHALMDQALARTPGAQRIAWDKKGLKGPQKDLLRARDDADST